MFFYFVRIQEVNDQACFVGGICKLSDWLRFLGGGIAVSSLILQGGREICMDVFSGVDNVFHRTVSVRDWLLVLVIVPRKVIEVFVGAHRADFVLNRVFMVWKWRRGMIQRYLMWPC